MGALHYGALFNAPVHGLPYRDKFLVRLLLPGQPSAVACPLQAGIPCVIFKRFTADTSRQVSSMVFSFPRMVQLTSGVLAASL